MRKAMLLAPTSVAFLWLALTGGARAQGRGQAVQLPDGNGKEIVEKTCSSCHGLNLITGSWGNTQAGWQELFASMVALPKEQADTVSAYLATHFPTKPAPAAVVIAGPANVSVQGWLAPTPGT